MKLNMYMWVFGRLLIEIRKSRVSHARPNKSNDHERVMELIFCFNLTFVLYECNNKINWNKNKIGLNAETANCVRLVQTKQLMELHQYALYCCYSYLLLIGITCTHTQHIITHQYANVSIWNETKKRFVNELVNKGNIWCMKWF